MLTALDPLYRAFQPISQIRCSNQVPPTGPWGPSRGPKSRYQPLPHGSFQHWSSEVRQHVEKFTDNVILDELQNTTAENLNGPIQTDPENWFQGPGFNPAGSPAGSPARAALFSTPMGDQPVQCERCGQLYDKNMVAVPQGPENDNDVQFSQMSFVFCSQNESGACVQNASTIWKAQRLRIFHHRRKDAQCMIKILGQLDPKRLIYEVFGFSYNHLEGLGELQIAYQALRVIWIQSLTMHLRDNAANNPTMTGNFQGPAPGSPTDANVTGATGSDTSQDQYPAPNSPNSGFTQTAQETVDDFTLWLEQRPEPLFFWGDVKQDLALVSSGWVRAADIAYVYGVSREGLQLLVHWNWDNEIEWLNAYAGMRRRVGREHYQLMRTASQRVGTAMERLVQAISTNHMIKPGQERLYAMSGMRFRELESALCADMSAVENGQRAIDKPLDQQWWKDATECSRGVRVQECYIYWPPHHVFQQRRSLPGRQVRRVRR